MVVTQLYIAAIYAYGIILMCGSSDSGNLIYNYKCSYIKASLQL